jgi:FkbM family methyltransferase
MLRPIFIAPANSLAVLRTNIAPKSAGWHAISRYWSWTISRRILRRGGTISHSTGGLLELPSWSRGGGFLFATGFTEPRDQVFVSALTRPGDLMIDVGSNIGMYSVTAGVRGASVVAVEPMPRAAEATRRNLALNSIEGIVHEVAASDHDGASHFEPGDLNARLDDSGSMNVPVVRLDSIPIDTEALLSILKIDTEGHDLMVLKGAADLIARAKPVVLVEVWEDSSDVRSFLSECGYEFYLFDWRQCKLTGTGIQKGNLLALHADRIEMVKERLASGGVVVRRPVRQRVQ